MIGMHDHSPYVRLCSLYNMTYYFYLKALRQYGYRQLVPANDTITPKIYGLPDLEWNSEVEKVLKSVQFGIPRKS